jgi:hypothetical protein
MSEEGTLPAKGGLPLTMLVENGRPIDIPTTPNRKQLGTSLKLPYRGVGSFKKMCEPKWFTEHTPLLSRRGVIICSNCHPQA